MSDFFSTLELELRAAAERPPRRLPALADRAHGAGVGLAIVAALAVALVPALLILGGGDEAKDKAAAKQPAVGTVTPAGTGTPPRDSDSTVVATGTAPVAGPWELELYRSTVLKDPETGDVYQRAGLPCLTIIHLHSSHPRGNGASGFCGGNSTTPGFTRAQTAVPTEGRTPAGQRLRADVVLVYGWAPKQARFVTVSTFRGSYRAADTHPGPPGSRRTYYVVPVKPGLGSARITWLDKDGNEGGRGLGLMPPITKR
jgi:hypothetical protein